MAEVNNADESIIIQQLNHTLRDLFMLWFSVGFLHIERITWESACDILQKVSDHFCVSLECMKKLVSFYMPDSA